MKKFISLLRAEISWRILQIRLALYDYFNRK